MLWGDYLKRILEQETVFDNLSFSLNDENPIAVPPIIKASILLTDRFLGLGRKNMLMFPEQQSCSFVFMLLRTLFNISKGQIKKDYNPYSFIPGERLKLKNSIVEFVGIRISKEDGAKRIYVKSADGIYTGMLLETAPFLQHVQTKRLSKDESFSREYHLFLEEHSLNSSKTFTQELYDYRTHLNSSTILVAPILNTRKLLLETTLNEDKVSDFLLLAQSDPDGNIKNMTAGQLSGIPAIVLCQDLYTVNKVIEAGLVVNSIFIEAAQITIDNQLDALDDLIKINRSIVLLANRMNFNDFSSLESRGFNIWTWDEKTISSDIYGNDTSEINIRTKNAAQRKINFVDVQCPEISDSVSLLYKNKKLIEGQSATIIQVYQDLFEIALIALRAISPLENCAHILEILEKCKRVLIQEKGYIKKELFVELDRVIENLLSVYTSGFALPKIEVIAKLLKKVDKSRVFIIVPQNVNKDKVEQYLKTFYPKTTVDIVTIHPNEYLLQDGSINGLTIISGWLNKLTMNKILNANITDEITVLLHGTEKRWKNGYIHNDIEQAKYSNSMNSRIMSSIEGSLVTDLEDIEEDIPPSNHNNDVELREFEGLEEIELALNQNKYRQYISQTTEGGVEAIPVSFVGDLLAFYKTGHTLLTATKLINENYDSIEEVKPSEVQIGDFIIERETQRDLIRDIADVILKNSGYSDLRETAHKWKETLEVESVFSNEETIYEQLRSAGCNKSRITVQHWLYDNDMITPQSKEDIICVAKATKDSVLLEMVDSVFEAGKTIKRAHIKAGHHLAEKLRAYLAAALSSVGSIDSFNIWQPIEIEIESVGIVKLLKVIDIGSKVLVDTTSTNRLIDTNRVTMQGS